MDKSHKPNFEGQESAMTEYVVFCFYECKFLKQKTIEIRMMMPYEKERVVIEKGA